MTDRLTLCRVEPLRKALRQLGTTPQHLQDQKKHELEDWIRKNCDVDEVADLAIEIGGEIDPVHYMKRRKTNG